MDGIFDIAKNYNSSGEEDDDIAVITADLNYAIAVNELLPPLSTDQERKEREAMEEPPLPLINQNEKENDWRGDVKALLDAAREKNELDGDDMMTEDDDDFDHF